MSIAIDHPFIGHSLNIAQRVSTKNALLKVKIQEDSPSLSFWGQIQGIEKDYLIAVAVTFKLNVIHKQWFYSHDDGATFARLDSIDDWAKQNAAKIRGPFKGNPAYKYPAKQPTNEDEEEQEQEDETDHQEEEEEEANDEELTEEEKQEREQRKKDKQQADPNKNRKLLEVERLWYTISQIDHDTGIVPVGTFVQTPTKDVIRNQFFQGLTVPQIKKLSSYLLLRPAKSLHTLANVHKGGVSNITQFLDTLEEEEPKGVWSAQIIDAGLRAVLRNLKWPGFEFHIEAHSPTQFAGVYYGSGEKNYDLPFML